MDEQATTAIIEWFMGGLYPWTETLGLPAGAATVHIAAARVRWMQPPASETAR